MIKINIALKNRPVLSLSKENNNGVKKIELKYTGIKLIDICEKFITK